MSNTVGGYLVRFEGEVWKKYFPCYYDHKTKQWYRLHCQQIYFNQSLEDDNLLQAAPAPSSSAGTATSPKSTQAAAASSSSACTATSTSTGPPVTDMSSTQAAPASDAAAGPAGTDMSSTEPIGSASPTTTPPVPGPAEAPKKPPPPKQLKRMQVWECWSPPSLTITFDTSKCLESGVRLGKPLRTLAEALPWWPASEITARRDSWRHGGKSVGSGPGGLAWR